ncbi:hypothetical protein D1007_43673 [Hordeum vulgare]|uniref:Predicted protein n=1 Tax=Hordeum vulgare subsp. vulgare TaxID=112509 RepID=F2EBD0_HORVV|nr:uncharacterized protein LOC123440519 [Hordeum vulgare subsp. vulgare]KAE8782927.1 hypothetical protein D1007_43673 [Hordeum vulgare]KAI5003742.1 hypothetical protein ZWY2020_030902 [Hordeum vulgare]KAI5003746.1 hypothetical protein ZWY2020_030906 [Hordeum vulgare]BAK04652.1 predicted protein [Hordeum vulgare subsp. vulgare]
MRKGSECTRISPETTTSGNPMFSRQASRSSGRAAPPSERDALPRHPRGACRLLRTARWTAARLYRRARVSVVTAFWSAPSRRASSSSSAASRSPECTPARNSSRRQSGPVVVADDSHKSEAVEECIRFMNSSSRKYR